MLGLKKSCHNTPLLEALKINKISNCVESQQLKLLKSMLLSTSKSKPFYTHLLSQYLSGAHMGNTLLSRVANTCREYNVSIISVLCNEGTHKSVIRSLKMFPESNGVTDSIRGLLVNNNNNSNTRMLLNLLLRSY